MDRSVEPSPNATKRALKREALDHLSGPMTSSHAFKNANMCTLSRRGEQAGHAESVPIIRVSAAEVGRAMLEALAQPPTMGSTLTMRPVIYGNPATSQRRDHRQ
jgi:hypothetical protein